MQRFSIVLLVFIVWGCSQKKFIGGKVLTQFSLETIYCDVYQTGLDNYTIEIKSRSGNDVLHLFNYYINDGIFTAKTLKATIKGDTAIIFSSHPVGKEMKQTKERKFVVMRRL